MLYDITALKSLKFAPGRCKERTYTLLADDASPTKLRLSIYKDNTLVPLAYRCLVHTLAREPARCSTLRSIFDSLSATRLLESSLLRIDKPREMSTPSVEAPFNGH